MLTSGEGWCDADGVARDPAADGADDETEQCAGRRKNSTAARPGPPSNHAVFSKGGEGTAVFPFPRRNGPDGDHSTGDELENFRSWWY